MSAADRGYPQIAEPRSTRQRPQAERSAGVGVSGRFGCHFERSEKSARLTSEYGARAARSRGNQRDYSRLAAKTAAADSGRLYLVVDAAPEAYITEVAQLLRAIEFSAYKHRAQKRKDADASPYINHPIAVATLLATVGGVRDLEILIAAVLHDTLEDTETTPAELEDRFGARVRGLVEEMSDDKSLPKAVRKQLQVDHAPQVSADAKVIKLADKIANIRDVCTTPPSDWSLERRREYLDWTRDVIAGCRGVNPGLEACYDEALVTGRRKLGLENDPALMSWRNRVGNPVTPHPYGRDNQSSE